MSRLFTSKCSFTQFAILRFIDKLAKLRTDKILELNNRLQPIVEHNYQLLIDNKFLKA